MNRDQLMSERWKPVVGFIGYEVSARGRVRSMIWRGRGNRQKPNATPKILKAWLGDDGYRRITLRRDGKSYARKVAWLVLEAFVGPRPARHDACHNDGERTNDARLNLRWDTRRANLADRGAHGTLNRGDRNGAATLKPSDVRSIRTRLAAGDAMRAIAEAFNVHQSTISKIKRGERWGWL